VFAGFVTLPGKLEKLLIILAGDAYYKDRYPWGLMVDLRNP